MIGYSTLYSVALYSVLRTNMNCATTDGRRRRLGIFTRIHEVCFSLLPSPPNGFSAIPRTNCGPRIECHSRLRYVVHCIRSTLLVLIDIFLGVCYSPSGLPNLTIAHLLRRTRPTEYLYIPFPSAPGIEELRWCGRCRYAKHGLPERLVTGDRKGRTRLRVRRRRESERRLRREMPTTLPTLR